MINSLKNNKAIRSERKKLFEINKEYEVSNKKPLKFRQVSEAQKEEYKAKLKEYKLAQKRMMLFRIIITLLIFGGILAFIYYQFSF
ncbi:MAG: hypothetical protein K9H84_07920 [Bacteroidales bacterium]|nr:hypothetical protein [Bacteroidales bacterium]